MKYWLFDGDETSGPYALDELKRLDGFNPETLICPTTAVGENPWKPAKELPEMHSIFLKPPPAPGRPKPPGPPPPPKAAQAAAPQGPAANAPPGRPARACPHCGGRTPGGAAYCNHCGSPLPRSSQGAARSNAEDAGSRMDGKSSAPKKRKPSVNGPVLFVLLSALAALAWILYPAFKPEPAPPPGADGAPDPAKTPSDPWAGKEEDAVDFTADLHLKSPLFPKCPSGLDGLSAVGREPLARIKSWKEVKTLGEQIRCRPFAELAFQAVLLSQTKEMKPEDAARHVINGIKEIGGPEKFYSSSWTATRVGGSVFRVEAGVEDEINNAAQETYFPELHGLRDEFKPLGDDGDAESNPPSRPRVFFTDLAARTVRPGNFSGWREIDPKAAADWARQEAEAHPGGKVARGEPDKVDLSDVAPVYGSPPPKPRVPSKNPRKKKT